MIISSAFVGSIFSVYSFLGVRSLSLTCSFSLFIRQYLALSEISMNFSGSLISCGILVLVFVCDCCLFLLWFCTCLCVLVSLGG